MWQRLYGDTTPSPNRCPYPKPKKPKPPASKKKTKPQPFNEPKPDDLS